MALILVGPSKYLKQTIQMIELNRVKNPTWQTSWPFKSMVKDLNLGLPLTNAASGQSRT